MSVRPACAITTLCLLLLCSPGNAGTAVGSDHPLAPPDTTSPRATIKTFLDNMNEAISAYKAGRKDQAVGLANRAARCLNLEEEPPALRYVLGFYTTLYLKETLDRIEIPPDHDIPDAKTMRTANLSSWTIPYTEITIAASQDKDSVQRFLFTSDTVRNAEKYYRVVRTLPYRPDSGHGALLEQLAQSGSMIIPRDFLARLPTWCRVQLFGQAAWQWVGLVLYACLAAMVILLLCKWGGRALHLLDTKYSWRLEHTVGGLVLPVTLVLVSRIGLWLLVYGLRILNADVYVPIAMVFLFISYAGWIWFIGAVLNRIAMVFVSAGGFVEGGVDDQLIRLSFQILTVIIVAVMALDLGARLGLPTYSLVTGLGIGGLAVALAGREALSNIIGTVMIILDRPFQLGDFIVLGEGQRGKVAHVGLRSTRIWTRDDILISIPNSVIANAKMINESAPLSMSRIRIKVGVAYGSNLNQVELVLKKVAQQNQTVLSDPAPRVRFRDFGDSALALELLCWIDLPEQKGRTIHELNWAINEEFQKLGIEIPFPQRDVHMRTES